MVNDDVSRKIVDVICNLLSSGDRNTIDNHIDQLWKESNGDLTQRSKETVTNFAKDTNLSQEDRQYLISKVMTDMESFIKTHDEPKSTSQVHISSMKIDTSIGKPVHTQRHDESSIDVTQNHASFPQRPSSNTASIKNSTTEVTDQSVQQKNPSTPPESPNIYHRKPPVELDSISPDTDANPLQLVSYNRERLKDDLEEALLQIIQQNIVISGTALKQLSKVANGAKSTFDRILSNHGL